MGVGRTSLGQDPERPVEERRPAGVGGEPERAFLVAGSAEGSSLRGERGDQPGQDEPAAQEQVAERA